MSNAAQHAANGFANLVAWNLLDGSPMVGNYVAGFDLCGKVHVKRIDGTTCTVEAAKLRPATEAEYNAAYAFFTRKG